jgi:hypothetical protein
MESGAFGDAIDMIDAINGPPMRGGGQILRLHHSLRHHRNYDDAINAIQAAKKGGENINGKDASYGATPVGWMIAMRQPNYLAMALIDEGADATIKDNQGKSALDYAVTYKNQQIIDYINQPKKREELCAKMAAERKK